MPTPTYIPLGTITLASTDSEIVFSSIPATYRDLILVGSARSTYTPDPNDDLILQFNADTGANYTTVGMGGDGTFNFSFTSTNVRAGGLQTSNGGFTGFGTQIAQLMDYSATDKQKTILSRSASNAATQAYASRWANSANAISSIKLFSSRGANFAIGSTFSLYGVN